MKKCRDLHKKLQALAEKVKADPNNASLKLEYANVAKELNEEVFGGGFACSSVPFTFFPRVVIHV